MPRSELDSVSSQLSRGTPTYLFSPGPARSRPTMRFQSTSDTCRAGTHRGHRHGCTALS